MSSFRNEIWYFDSSDLEKKKNVWRRVTPSRHCPFLMWSPYSMVDFVVDFFSNTAVLSRKIDQSRFFLAPPLQFVRPPITWSGVSRGVEIDRQSILQSIFDYALAYVAKTKKSTKYRSISVQPLHHPQAHHAPITYLSDDENTLMKKYVECLLD